MLEKILKIYIESIKDLLVYAKLHMLSTKYKWHENIWIAIYIAYTLFSRVVISKITAKTNIIP